MKTQKFFEIEINSVQSWGVLPKISRYNKTEITRHEKKISQQFSALLCKLLMKCLLWQIVDEPGVSMLNAVKY